MKNLLQAYKQKPPEIVFEWNDSESEAKGWIIINSLRGGGAGGGTRMREGLTREEVISLSKVMEIKFSVAGPAIGGAKSGINFNPRDPRREDVLKRWYKAIFPILKSYYGTGGDLNVDELRDVIPITEDLGLWHPQEGIVNGHFPDIPKGDKINIIGQLRQGCSKIVEDPAFAPAGGKKYAVADLITGYGVAESVRHYYELFEGRTSQGRTAIIQGWGNVAATAAYYLAGQGVKVLGIIDRLGGLISEEGMGQAEIEKLFNEREGNQLKSDDLMPFEEVNNRIWDLGADIFIPAAASKLISPTQAEQLQKAGTKVISCGANVPFSDDDVFFGPTATSMDAEISIIPDFIANCGMARVFAYLMQPDIEVTDEAIFGDVSQTIHQALAEVKQDRADGKKLSTVALEQALHKLMH